MYQFCDSFDKYSTTSELYELVSGPITHSSACARFAPPSGLPGQAVKFAAGRFLACGNYTEREYRSLLGRNRGMIFLCEHESQRLAYQEYLSCSVPVLAWE